MNDDPVAILRIEHWTTLDAVVHDVVVKNASGSYVEEADHPSDPDGELWYTVRALAYDPVKNTLPYVRIILQGTEREDMAGEIALYAILAYNLNVARALIGSYKVGDPKGYEYSAACLQADREYRLKNPISGVKVEPIRSAIHTAWDEERERWTKRAGISKVIGEVPPGYGS